MLTNEKRLKASRRVDVTVKYLQDTMNQYYRIIRGYNEEKDDKIAL